MGESWYSLNNGNETRSQAAGAFASTVSDRVVDPVAVKAADARFGGAQSGGIWRDENRIVSRGFTLKSALAVTRDGAAGEHPVRSNVALIDFWALLAGEAPAFWANLARSRKPS